MNEYLVDGPDDAKVTFLFAHGAGAGMDHEFMAAIATGLAKTGIKVVRFNFPYMVKRAEDGKKRPPDRQPKLTDDFLRHIEAFSQYKLVIGGKSMGGRMASIIANEANVVALACLGFPFHPPGKLDKFKGDHLADLKKPSLILQGDRDTFGKREEVEGYAFSESVTVRYIPDGDHSFKPRKASGYTEDQNRQQVVKWLSEFIWEQVDAN